MRWFRDSRGAVTVMVTLLLIPAVLISGTGVDIARIYTARSVLQDSDQLALNSVLADYDALLQDMYGLFAVTQKDEELKKLVNEYVEKSITAPDASAEGNNVLKLFYGSNIKSELETGEGRTLDNKDELRRQIEEYAKIRAPIILVNELLDRLDELDKVNADAEIINDKVDIEDKIEDIDKYYEKIFNTLEHVDGFQEVGAEADEDNRGYEEIEGNVMVAVNGPLVELEYNFTEMKTARSSYETSVNNGDEEHAAEMKAYYEALKKNCNTLIDGGKYGENWDAEKLKWGTTYDIPSFYKVGETCAKKLEDYVSKNQSIFSSKEETLENLKENCEKADEEKAELKKMIDALRKKLDTSNCHDELKTSLGGDGGLLDTYEQLVDYDLTKLSSDMYDHDAEHINSYAARLRALGKETCYATFGSPEKLYTLEELKSAVADMDIDITFINAEREEEGQDPLYDGLQYFGDGSKSSPAPIEPAGEYYTWIECGDRFEEPEYKDFLESLKSLYSGTNDTKKKKAEKSVTTLFKATQDMFSGLIVEPEGAWKLSGGKGTGSGSTFGSGSDWGEKGKAKKELKKSLNDDIFTRLTNAADSLTNKALLYTYATEMFSCYTTESGEENMAGIPMDVDINYFFQSELEYIYNGDLADAINNHNAVGSMILLIRFIMDYIASFSVESVNYMVDLIKTSLAGLGPIAVAIAELARLAIATAESFIDLSLLREGHKVALMKNDDTWKFQVETLLEVSEETLKGAMTNGAADTSDDTLDDDNGLYYIDYLRLFLLFVNGDTMAERVGKLIELNMTNKKSLAKNLDRTGRENAMAEAERFDLAAARTGFVLTVSADMNMMFLSMPMAQKGLDGLIPPKTLPVSAVGYRGY